MPAENEGQVERFMSETRGFRVGPAGEVTPALAGRGAGPDLSLTPARDDTDGFFAAVMERDPA